MPCRICKHKQRDLINTALAEGVAIETVAESWRLPVAVVRCHLAEQGPHHTPTSHEKERWSDGDQSLYYLSAPRPAKD
jgi:hypothetical protein